MKKRNLASPRAAQTARNGSNAKGWRFYSLIFMCSLLIVAGFFFAARQHFSSMDYGMKNSRLRKQLDELTSEKQRLLLAREVAQSPAELKKAAKKVGLNDAGDAGAELAKLVPDAKTKTAPLNAAPVKTSVIQKTVAVTAAYTSPASLGTGRERIAKQSKKSSKAE